jgi:hypothetical protein
MIVCLCPGHNPQQHYYVGFREREMSLKKCTPQVNTFVTTGTLTFQRGGHGKMAVSEKRVCAYDEMVGHLLALRTSALWPSFDCR